MYAIFVAFILAVQWVAVSHEPPGQVDAFMRQPPAQSSAIVAAVL